MVLLDDSDKIEVHNFKTEIMLKILKEYRVLLEYSLNIKFSIIENNEMSSSSNSKEIEDLVNIEQDDGEKNHVIKLLERQIECKLLSIDIVNSIVSFFLNESNINLICLFILILVIFNS